MRKRENEREEKEKHIKRTEKKGEKVKTEGVWAKKSDLGKREDV